MDPLLIAQTATGHSEVAWIVENFSKVTLTSGLLWIVYASYKGVFVWGNFHRETVKSMQERHDKEIAKLEKDRDEWKTEAKANKNTLRQAANVAEKQAETIAIVAASSEKK